MLNSNSYDSILKIQSLQSKIDINENNKRLDNNEIYELINEYKYLYEKDISTYEMLFNEYDKEIFHILKLYDDDNEMFNLIFYLIELSIKNEYSQIYESLYFKNMIDYILQYYCDLLTYFDNNSLYKKDKISQCFYSISDNFYLFDMILYFIDILEKENKKEYEIRLHSQSHCINENKFINNEVSDMVFNSIIRIISNNTFENLFFEDENYEDLLIKIINYSELSNLALIRSKEMINILRKKIDLMKILNLIKSSSYNDCSSSDNNCLNFEKRFFSIYS